MGSRTGVVDLGEMSDRVPGLALPGKIPQPGTASGSLSLRARMSRSSFIASSVQASGSARLGLGLRRRRSIRCRSTRLVRCATLRGGRHSPEINCRRIGTWLVRHSSGSARFVTSLPQSVCGTGVGHANIPPATLNGCTRQFRLSYHFAQRLEKIEYTRMIAFASIAPTSPKPRT